MPGQTKSKEGGGKGVEDKRQQMIILENHSNSNHLMSCMGPTYSINIEACFGIEIYRAPLPLAIHLLMVIKSGHGIIWLPFFLDPWVQSHKSIIACM